MERNFKLSIMTPKKNFFEGEVTQLNLNIANGRIGFLAEHLPTVSYIKTSRFSIIENGVIKEGVIIGGVVYMNGKDASIITSRVKWLSDVDREHATERLKIHEENLKNPNINSAEKEILNQKILYYQKQLG